MKHTANAPERAARVGSAGLVRRRRALLTALAIILAMAVPLGFTFQNYWQSTGADLAHAQRESIGARYLAPLYTLLGVLAGAESGAVENAAAPPTALNNAVLAVGAADAAYGDALGTHESWSDLHQDLTALSGRPGAPAAAYTEYTQLINATTSLIAQVADSSALTLDPELDSYYLADTLLQRIPNVVSDSAGAASLTYLARAAAQSRAQSAGSTAQGTTQGTQGGSDQPGAVQVVTALDRIAANTAASGNGLERAFSDSTSGALGPDLMGPVDRLRAAVAAMAPSTQLIALPAVLPQSAAIHSESAAVQSAALALASATLTELQQLFATRESHIADQRLQAAGEGVPGVAVAALLLWSLLPKRSRDFELDTDEDEAESAPALESEIDALIEARTLLAAGELVRVGRAVVPRRSAPGDSRDEP